MKKIIIPVILTIAMFTINAKENDTKSKNTDTKSQATMVLSGTIADEISKESLVGVEVKIEGTDMKTYTDFDGNFSFEGLKPGEYKLVTNYISYKKRTRLLDLKSNEKDIKIKLQSSD